MRKFLSYSSIIFVLLISSGSTSLVNDKYFIVAGWLFFTLAHIYTEKLVKFLLLRLIGIFTLISIFYYLINFGYDTVTYLGFFIKICLAYYCRDICKENFFPYLIKVIYIATCISIPLFIIQLINFDFLFSINNIFKSDNPISSSIIFTLAPIHLYRNCGFMWEPGAFAAILILTIYINTFREKESIFSTKNKVFVLAMLTTQSTMGFLSLFIPIGFLIFEKFSQNKLFRKISIFIIPSFIAIFYLLYSNVDFLSQKINKEIQGIEEEMAFIDKGNKDNFVVAATRTASVILDFQTIKRYPLFGLGIDMKTTGRNKLAIGDMTITACGLTNLLVRFGIVGFLVYLFIFYDRAFFETKAHRMGWVFLICFILFSNELSASSFIHLFVF